MGGASNKQPAQDDALCEHHNIKVFRSRCHGKEDLPLGPRRLSQTLSNMYWTKAGGKTEATPDHPYLKKFRSPYDKCLTKMTQISRTPALRWQGVPSKDPQKGWIPKL